MRQVFCNYNNQHYGYFNKGKTPIEYRVSKREKLSVIAAIHPTEGLFSYCKQHKPFDSDTFYCFISSLIHNLPKGVKAIIMDNVAFHRSKKVTQLLQSHNIVPLFIPPYSPRCNPIEEVFSFMKRYYRMLDPSTNSLNYNVDQTLEKIKLYKDNIIKHYKHTRGNG
jgi:transposase